MTLTQNSTPMLDLLVSLAAQNRLNPTELTLELISEDTGAHVTYKPNQTIGSLGCRVVHIVNRHAGEATKAVTRNSRKEKPFEVTQRFTVNLPKGKKAVVRVSPQTTLGEVLMSVCKDKGLDPDLRRYDLQIPKNPGAAVELDTTIQQIGVHEVNLVPFGHQDKNHTMSLPDLSKPPPSSKDLPLFAQQGGQPKKKRGFLSFLVKKEKKFKPENRRSLESSSTFNLSTSSLASSQPPTPTSAQKSDSLDDRQAARPKSMFVLSNSLPLDEKSQEHNLKPLIAPPRKKRRAPEPPVVVGSQIVETGQNSSVEAGVTVNKGSTDSSLERHINSKTNEQAETAASVGPLQNQNDVPKMLHSRDSSDSSGYHDLTLSICESPEFIRHSKAMTNNDKVFPDVTDTFNGESRMCPSPIPESLNENIHERSDVTDITGSVTHSLTPDKFEKITSSQKSENPVPTHITSPSAIVASITTSSSAIVETTGDRNNLVTELGRKDVSLVAKNEVKDVSLETKDDMKDAPLVTKDALKKVSLTKGDVRDVSIVTKDEVKAKGDVKDVSLVTKGDVKDVPLVTEDVVKDVTDVSVHTYSDSESRNESSGLPNSNLSGFDEMKDESTTMDFNDILDGVVFDDEPWSMELSLAKRAGVWNQEKDDMLMMETASVTSENIDQIGSSSIIQRPCAFIPPPPPSEPPPPEHLDLQPLTSATAPVFVDKGTEVNDDNTSLAASSAKSSPGRASSGYMNEMAVFVEKISSVTLGNTEEREETLLRDSLEDASTHNLITSVNIKSVIGQLQAGILDSGSQMEPDTWDDSNCLQTNSSDKQSSFDETVTPDQSNEGFNLPKDAQIPRMTVLLPPEFNDSEVIKNNNKSTTATTDDDYEEEYYTEIIEEHVIPLGPHGYDFAAARKTSEIVLSSGRESGYLKNAERKNELNLASKIFTPSFNTFTPGLQTQPKVVDSVKLLVKEDFQLMSRDLKMPGKEDVQLTSKDLKPPAKDDFPLKSKDLKLPGKEVPPTSKDLSSSGFTASRIDAGKNNLEYQSIIRGSTASENVLKHGYSTTGIKTSPIYEHTHPKSTHFSTTTSNEPQHISVTVAKSTTLSTQPSLRPSAHFEKVPASADNDYLSNNDPVLTKSRPHLLMNSHSNPLRRSVIDQKGSTDYTISNTAHHRPFISGTDSDAVAGSMELAGSLTSAYNAESLEQQDVLQRQYLALQSQFQQWQEQLAWNQSLLASQAVGSEPQAEHLQQLSEQMTIQQQMAMQQLRSTMLALQQQKQMQASDLGELSAELPARINQPVGGAAEPAYDIVASPPLSPPPPPQKQSAALQPRSTAAKKRPKVERELEPREQLMIAIRSFSKKDLKSVPIEKTRWTSLVL